MKKINFCCIAFFMFLVFGAQAQSDSLAVAGTLTNLLNICKNVDFNDSKTTGAGTFYKAAPYIVYQGDNKTRQWKDFANYSDEEEKEGVDEICLRINSLVNEDSAYKIVKYITETESEGTWHIMLVSFLKKGESRQAAFAFLKIKGKFGLGDID